ncbi:hypothetical protein KP509_23G077000 [Ceratopteris richardii]|uniref:Uncharacterized protein n=1 Tax=Ceratopteris richardii TaxID=49495 RepID=A0A8T2S1C2_CERRI|nr:hypothetical protein KP509_23G077000 [Ceratopteris richardii]
MEQSPGYRECIEDSIRRCEELLALSPLALETSGLRRSFSGKEQHPNTKKACSTKEKEDLHVFPAQELWKRNMDLLVSGSAKLQEIFEQKSGVESDVNNLKDSSLGMSTSESQGSHESIIKSSDNISEISATINQRAHVNGTTSDDFSAKSPIDFVKDNAMRSECSGASSEWVMNGTCQDSDSQSNNLPRPLSKIISIDETYDRLHVVLPSDVSSATQSIVTDAKFNESANLYTKARRHSIEVIATRLENSSEAGLSSRTSPCIIDADFKEDESCFYAKDSHCSLMDRSLSENEENRLSSQSGRQGNSSECLQSSTPDGSGISHLALGVSWDTPDRTSSESEHKINITGSLGDERHSNHIYISRQKRDRPQDERRSKSVPKEAFMDRLQILARPRTEIYRKLAELKAMLEREKLQQFSFKPKVGRKPDPESTHSAPIMERIVELQQRFGLRKRARKAYEKEELDNCSFWPRINFRSQVYDKITYQPIQERFQELQRRKFEKIANAQLRMNMGLTFKPEINQKSIQLCKQKGLEMIDVAQRLSALQPSVHLDCKIEPQKNQSTFSPEINKNTDYIIATSKQFKGCCAGFLERQKQYLQTLEEKKKSKEQGSTFDLSFRPNIGNSILILKQSHSQDVLQETPGERFRRLAYKDKEQLWHAREKASEAYYSQFNFHPEIDEVSRILASNKSVYDLYKNEKGRKVKEALEQAAENEFQQKCPFRPEVRTRKNEGCRLKSVIVQRRQLRQEKASTEQESRILRELEALKECTFKPAVNPVPPAKETAPAAIKGLERHLELQCIAKQMRREQEELERKVFFSHACSLPMRQYTIPRPFVLHTAQARYQKRA